MKLTFFTSIWIALFALFTFVNYSVDMASGRLALSLGNILLALAWPLVAFGVILYFYCKSRFLEILAGILFSSKLAIVIYLSWFEHKNFLLVKDFWISLIVFCVGISFFIFWNLKNHNKEN